MCVSDLGDPICGPGLLLCDIQTQVRGGRRGGVSHHCINGPVLHPEAQQDHHLLLLAPGCE